MSVVPHMVSACVRDVRVHREAVVGGDDGMRRAYVFRLRPTARQHTALAACLDAHRELYNAALQERRDAWSHSKTRINYGDQSAQLTEIRSARPDQAVWAFSSQQATLQRLNRAFGGFFRRVKAGQKAGYPRFKGVRRFDSVEWPRDGDGARWRPDAHRVYLWGVGAVQRGTTCLTERPLRAACREASVTLVGVNSFRFCAPKRKTLGVSG